MQILPTVLRIRLLALALTLPLWALACGDTPPSEPAQTSQAALQGVATIEAPRTNVHTYTDQCFCKWGLVDASFPEIKLNDARMRTIVPTWGGRKYRWDAATKQYEFETLPGSTMYKPAALNFPEKGVGGPITTLDQLKCDRPSHVAQSSSCALGQKRLEFVDPNTKISWAFIFRRADSEIPGEPWGPRHKNNYIVIDVEAHKLTTAKNADADNLEQNAVCWWDTVKKRGTAEFAKEVPDDWTLPRPGGRYGGSKAEKDRYDAVMNFWDNVNDGPPPNPRDRTNKDFGQDCTGCHSNGPVLDSAYFRQTDGRPRRDDDRPFHNIEFPVMDLKFFQEAKVTGGGCAGGCHKYWAKPMLLPAVEPKGTATCAGGFIAESYVTVQTVMPLEDPPSPPLLSKWRKGIKNWEPGNAAGEVTPAPGNKDARRTLIMPNPMDDPLVAPKASACGDVDVKGNCVVDWEEQHKKRYDNTKACCTSEPACKAPSVDGKPPVYYPEQEAPPATKPYNEKIKSPSLSAANVSVEIIAPCADATPACDVRIRWEDPVDGDANRHRVPRAYSLDSLEKAPAASGENFAAGDLNCRNKAPLVDPTSYESATEVAPGANSYKKKFAVVVKNAIRCNKVFKARVCGARCSTPTAVEPGALSPELSRTCAEPEAGAGGSAGETGDASSDACGFGACGSGGSGGTGFGGAGFGGTGFGGTGFGGCTGDSCGTGGLSGSGGFGGATGSGSGGGATGSGGFGSGGFGGATGSGGFSGTTATDAGSAASGGEAGGDDAGLSADALMVDQGQTLASGPPSAPLNLDEPSESESAPSSANASCTVQLGRSSGHVPWIMVSLGVVIARSRRRGTSRYQPDAQR